MGIRYDDFRVLPMEEKMRYIREYARSRLQKGERLWWLEDNANAEHTLPIQARLYTTLSTEEKTRLRAESALLCPSIVKPSNSRNKYDGAGDSAGNSVAAIRGMKGLMPLNEPIGSERVFRSPSRLLAQFVRQDKKADTDLLRRSPALQ
jgi:hypothetical protein